VSGKRQPRKDSSRYIVLLTLFVLAFTAIASRLAWIQVVKAPEYSAQATAQRLKDIELAPRRGTIYDREGEPLAVSVEAKTVFASPIDIEDKDAAAAALARTLGGDEDAYLEKIEGDSGFVYIERKVDLDRASELEKLLEREKIEGVGFIDDFRRIYPSGDLACQILGFVGVDDEGLAGLERQYEGVLGGTPGVVLGERDPRQRPIPGGIQKVIEPVHGGDVVLTIDKDIQHRAQVELAKVVKKWGAKSASAVVMNPRNGEIYAMATAPGFDPNKYGEAKADRVRNKPLTDAYEPGSTLKTLTAAAVIEEKLYTPESKFDLPSTIKVGGRTIHEAHGRAAVRWTLTDIVTNSSNVGTVKLGLKLGKEGLYDSFAAFGLTEAPSTDFPGTTRGWLPPTDQWSASSIGNIPFGQGVSVTSAQLARAVGAIANEGVLTTPHFLLALPASDAEPKAWPVRRAVSKETAHDVNQMLQAVVTEGTGSSAAVSGYTVAGKTGTAQKARSDGKGYSGGGYVGSFVGFLPADDPQVLVIVTVDRPTNAIYGGVVAGPTFSKLAQFSVSHLKIPPSSLEASESAAPDDGPGSGVGPVSDDEAFD